MSNHDDFVDDYIEYRIFEESMKRSGGGKPPKRNSGYCGCGTWAILAVIVIAVLILLASCTVSSVKSTSLQDSHNAESSYLPSNINYDYPDDFRNHEDAEWYWEEHQND